MALTPEQFEQLKSMAKSGGTPQNEFLSKIQQAKKIANERRTQQDIASLQTGTPETVVKEERGARNSFLSRFTENLKAAPKEMFGMAKDVVMDAPSDIAETFRSIKGDVEKRGEELGKDISNVVTGEVTSGEAFGTVPSTFFGTFADTIGGLFVGAAKVVSTPETEQAVKEGLESVVGEALDTDTAKMAIDKWNELPDAAKENLKDASTVLEFLADAAGLKGGKVISKSIKEGVEQGVKQADNFLNDIVTRLQSDPNINIVDEIEDGINKGIVSTEDLVQIKDVVSPDDYVRLTRAEQLSFPEMNTRLKNVVIGKEDLVVKYGEPAMMTNINPNQAPPMAILVDTTKDALKKVESIINDKGSNIGKFREKISTIRVYPDDIKSVDATLSDIFTKNDLQVKNGVVSVKKGGITELKSADVKAVQDIYDTWKNVKQAPTVENLIKARNRISNLADFNKPSSEVSKAIDPIAKKIRASIKNVNEKIVGKEQASVLAEYSDLLDFIDEFKSQSGKGKNLEFILKRVISERSSRAEPVFAKIKELTGVDLKEESQIAQAMTELMASKEAKGLLQQEITKSGLDIANIASGGNLGMIKGALNAAEKGLDLIKGEAPDVARAKTLYEKILKASRPSS